MTDQDEIFRVRAVLGGPTDEPAGTRGGVPDRQVLRAVHRGLLEVDDEGGSATPRSLTSLGTPTALRSTAGMSGTRTPTGAPRSTGTASSPASPTALTARRRRSG